MKRSPLLFISAPPAMCRRRAIENVFVLTSYRRVEQSWPDKMRLPSSRLQRMPRGTWVYILPLNYFTAKPSSFDTSASCIQKNAEARENGPECLYEGYSHSLYRWSARWRVTVDVNEKRKSMKEKSPCLISNREGGHALCRHSVKTWSSEN